jgi:hypothetical protein
LRNYGRRADSMALLPRLFSALDANKIAAATLA